MYAVVAKDENPKRFTTWHETFDQARIEAIRLADRNRDKQFVVLKAVGFAGQKLMPVEFTPIQSTPEPVVTTQKE